MTFSREPLSDHDRPTVMDRLKRCPDLLEDLEISVRRQGQTQPRRHTNRYNTSGSKTQVYDERAAHARDRLAAVLDTYSRQVGAYINRHVPNSATGQARFLTMRLPGVPGDEPAVAGLRAELTAAFAAGESAIDRPAARMYLGPCAECGTHLEVIAEESAAGMVCSGCGAFIDVTARRAQLLEAARDRQYPAPELAAMLPWFTDRAVTAATISKAGDRGTLAKHRTLYNGRMRTCYRVGDVIDHARGGRR